MEEMQDGKHLKFQTQQFADRLESGIPFTLVLTHLDVMPYKHGRSRCKHNYSGQN